LVQSSHPAIIAGFPGGPVGLHCLSAFGSVVTSLGGGESRRPAGGVSIAFRRLVQSSLHYGKVNHWTTGLESPLPFGVWFSRHIWSWSTISRATWRLHCLSAFGSVVTWAVPS